MSQVSATKTLPIQRRTPDGERHSIDDTVSLEEPLELRIRGQSIAITMRTPGHDSELAAGFAFTEGLIKQPGQLIEIAHCQRGEAEHPENIINLFLEGSASCNLEHLTRHVFASSSCGICGKASIEAIQKDWPPIESAFTTTEDTLLGIPHQLNQHQTQFQQTGGLHAAALVTQGGELVVVREDVGRHNAVDKVIGWGVLKPSFRFADHLLLVSGRASFEIMQKALAAGIPLVAAVSAPSSLAIDFAQTNRQTLVGFLRDATFNIYSHPQRVLASASPQGETRDQG